MTHRRTLATAAAVAMIGAVLTALPAGAAQSGSAPTAGQRAPGEPRLTACAEPRLAPALRIAPAPRRGQQPRGRATARKVAGQGDRLGAPARAQALAVTAVLAGDLEGESARSFFERLDRVREWRSLPPSVAVHRVLGTPDPFAYEQEWNRAVEVLGSMAAGLKGPADRVVAVGGRAPEGCRGSSGLRTLPLPPGSSYKVATEAVEAAAGPRGRVELQAPCGTPVRATTGGTVEVVTDDTGSGPWLIRVRSNALDVVTSYGHVQQPRVETGSAVAAGTPIAEVGDLGHVDACALGLRVTTNVSGDSRRVDPVRWLNSGLRLPTRERGTDPKSGRPEPETVPETTFRVGTYNVLGHHLTTPGGGRPRFGPGTTRVRRGLTKVEESGVSIVVLNEFESPQAGVVLADGDWGLHRATPNNRFRTGNTSGNAIAWRSDVWEKVGEDEFTYPWRTTLHYPVVFLEHRQTGAMVGVVGIHNPCCDAQRARVGARTTQLRWITRFREANPDVPIILAGDFNARASAFCGLTGTGVLAASAGGSVGAPCQVPRHGPVDWIFATTDLDFAGQAIDRSFLGGISDHPLVRATVTYPEHPEVAAPD